MMTKLRCVIVLVPLYKYRGDNITLPCEGLQFFSTFHRYNFVGARK